MDETGWGDESADVKDLVVVGSGAAGLDSAISAVRWLVRHGHGEMSAMGGTTAKSAAPMWIPNNPLMRSHGFKDPGGRGVALRGSRRPTAPSTVAPI